MLRASWAMPILAGQVDRGRVADILALCAREMQGTSEAGDWRRAARMPDVWARETREQGIFAK